MVTDEVSESFGTKGHFGFGLVFHSNSSVRVNKGPAVGRTHLLIMTIWVFVVCVRLHGMLCVVSAGSWTVLIIRQVVGPASSIRAINYPAGWTTPGTGTRQQVWSVVQTVQNTDSPVTSLYPGPELLSFWSN